ncbi:uncharacterized protein NPIL_14871 [Nephila pilipes]|uniref:Uncharacterized protein n=1 Tax=Nephila pilipes TaxID=299642 RepID=A0A8X6QDX5_NEPPI|nr:uncharacterized protein NPIL_14871 [Nephila pilipes]
MVAWSFSLSSDNSTIDNQLPSLRETARYWLSYPRIGLDIVTPLNPTITAPLLPQLVRRTDMKSKTTSSRFHIFFPPDNIPLDHREEPSIKNTENKPQVSSESCEQKLLLSACHYLLQRLLTSSKPDMIFSCKWEKNLLCVKILCYY